ncbi:MAG: hypothetical protein WCR47_03255 [Desulfoplanes sp.]
MNTWKKLVFALQLGHFIHFLGLDSPTAKGERIKARAGLQTQGRSTYACAYCDLFPIDGCLIFPASLQNIRTTTMESILIKQTLQKNRECVILLHGLSRTHRSMTAIEGMLAKNGYDVFNIGYPSRKYAIAPLAAEISRRIRDLDTTKYSRVHCVTHSMGGIILRQMLKHEKIAHLGRVVMLSPPNQGSEVVDRLKSWPLFQMLNGPAGGELGTENSNLPSSLGPVDFDLGVIVGRKTINWILSTMIPGENDGKVSTLRAQVPGMHDFLVVDATHPFIMTNQKVLRHILFYLHNGRFQHPTSS